MPLKTTAFINTNGHPYAADFFYRYPREVTLPKPEWLLIGPIVRVVQSDWNFLDLIKKINKEAKHPNILICMHGFNEGLVLPLTRSVDVNLHRLVADAIVQFACETDEEKRISEEQFGQVLGSMPSIRDLGELSDEINKLRSKRLNRIEIRACRVGGSDKTMRSLKRLFNCNTIVAPDIRDSYGYVNFRPFVSSESQTWQNFRRQHRHRVEGGTAGARYMVAGRRRGNTPEFDSFGIAESEAGVEAFISEHAPLIGGPLSDPVLIHGLFPRNRFIFTRNPEYRKHLKKL